MSEPKDNKIQTKAEREEKRRKEERANRRSVALYTTVGVVVVVAAIIMMVWSSGILQRTLTAVEVDGEKYTAADVDFYFNSVYNSIVNQYMQQVGMTPFDTGTSLKKQVYDPESGKTWYDYILERALNNLKSDTAISAKATAEGYELSEESQEQLDSTLAYLDTGWVGYSSSREAFVRSTFGSHMTYDRAVELLKMQTLSNDYLQTQLNGIEHGDEDYEAYYTENADTLDTYTLTQFLFKASVATTDEEGNTIEMTDEEKTAALEEAKAEQKALAEELKAKLEAGEDPQALAEEYSEQLYSSVVSRQTTGSSLTSAYSEWAMDESRQAGDITLSEYDGSTYYNYYVVVFEGRQRDDTPTANVRHVLVAAEQDEGAEAPTQEQYDAAYAEAEELLNQWKAGEATEETFAELAKENSADTGSAEDGGLISNISSNSGYVETFTNWALDPSRQPGDTDIVQNTGSSTKGWHIMYYVSSGDPIWKQTTASALLNQDYEQLLEDATANVTATEGVGMNFVSGK